MKISRYYFFLFFIAINIFFLFPHSDPFYSFNLTNAIRDEMCAQSMQFRARNFARSRKCVVHSLFPSKLIASSPIPLSAAYHYGLACAASGHSRLISSRISHLSPSFGRFRDREMLVRARAHVYACMRACVSACVRGPSAPFFSALVANAADVRRQREIYIERRYRTHRASLIE